MSKIHRAVSGKEYGDEHVDFLKEEGFNWKSYGNGLEYLEENVYVEVQKSNFYIRIMDEDKENEKYCNFIDFTIEDFYEKYEEMCNWVSRNK